MPSSVAVVMVMMVMVCVLVVQPVFGSVFDDEWVAAPSGVPKVSASECSALPYLRSIANRSEVLYHPEYELVAFPRFVVPDELPFAPPAPSNGSVPPTAISFTTIASLDRMPVLSMTARLWRGPMSVAVWVCDEEDVRALRRAVAREAFRPNLWLHVLVADTKPLFPFNSLRNLAVRWAPTDWLLLSDADAMVSKLHAGALMDVGNAWFQVKNRRRVMPETGEVEDPDKVLYIVNALKLPDQTDEKVTMKILAHTRPKALLKIAHKRNKLQFRYMPEWRWPYKGAQSLDSWLAATTAVPYPGYTFSFEPYVVFNRRTAAAPFRESLMGINSDKLLWTMELVAAGHTMWVLPRTFLMDPKAPPDHTNAEPHAQPDNMCKLVTVVCSIVARQGMAAKCDACQSPGMKNPNPTGGGTCEWCNSARRLMYAHTDPKKTAMGWFRSPCRPCNMKGFPPDWLQSGSMAEICGGVGHLASTVWWADGKWNGGRCAANPSSVEFKPSPELQALVDTAPWKV